MPERLRRLDRLFDRYPIFFITACIQGRRNLLACEAVHQRFIEFAKAGAERGAYVGAYVLMPDHLHLFVMLDSKSEKHGPRLPLTREFCDAHRAPLQQIEKGRTVLAAQHSDAKGAPPCSADYYLKKKREPDAGGDPLFLKGMNPIGGMRLFGQQRESARRDVPV